ncbi:DEAD/DEAH box helicase [Kitasatospora phosalacinea]|uniref:DEAD/DEAH box helicase n=1 Tax=Kitasatospora phosalacinea TaxID=2065 RepID=UPI00068CA08D|nr:DEAD/DEAH box helicase family protein [Kitasatospora phosalacinea]
MVWPELRSCQREAFDQYMADRKSKREWLAMLTPGAGKTIFALHCAAKLKEMGVVYRIAVYVPSDSLRQQWAEVAAVFGLHLVPVADDSDYNDSDFDGFVATYAQMKGAGAEHARRAVSSTPTIAVLDEVHHLGDSRSWGSGTQKALADARHILMLTGTPWRSDECSIPWCTYEPDPCDPSAQRVAVDFAYEYGEAVADGVCRAVEFHSYDAQLRYLEVGSETTKSLKDHGKGAKLGKMFDHVFDTEQPWTRGLLARAHELLTERRIDVPDAGGLVVTDTEDKAREIARILADLSGQMPTVVVSTDDEAVGKIDAFRVDGSREWIVAIRMVSEGVDIPRLMVGCYLSRWKTPLFFRQFMGRFVRDRAVCPADGLDAHIIIPAVRVFMDHAARVELELRDLTRLDPEDAADGGEERLAGPLVPPQPAPIDDLPWEGTEGREDPLACAEKLAADARESGQMALSFEPAVEVDVPEFYQSERRGVPMPSPLFLHGEQMCRGKGIPITYARQVAELHASTAPPPPPAVHEQQPPRFRKKRLLGKRVDTLVGRLAMMQARAAGDLTKERIGQNKRALNTRLLSQFGVKREECSMAVLALMEAKLEEAIAAESERFELAGQGYRG